MRRSTHTYLLQQHGQLQAEQRHEAGGAYLHRPEIIETQTRKDEPL